LFENFRFVMSNNKCLHLRVTTLDAPGTLHHVIIRGIERRRIVEDDHDRREFVNRLGKLVSETAKSIYAWALTTNHAHILLASGAWDWRDSCGVF
jgi:putative transposase